MHIDPAYFLGMKLSPQVTNDICRGGIKSTDPQAPLKDIKM